MNRLDFLKHTLALAVGSLFPPLATSEPVLLPLSFALPATKPLTVWVNGVRQVEHRDYKVRPGIVEFYNPVTGNIALTCCG